MSVTFVANTQKNCHLFVISQHLVELQFTGCPITARVTKVSQGDLLIKRTEQAHLPSMWAARHVLINRSPTKISVG